MQMDIEATSASEPVAPVAPGPPRFLETHSIDYVPWSERRGKVWHQGPFWFTSNFVLFTLAVGFSGPLGGLGLGWTTAAVALGAIVGTFFMAFHANQGPRLGIPQMIQSRAQFGTRGVLVALIAALFVYVGLNVFNLPMTTQGLQAVTRAGPRWPWYVGLVSIQAAIAIFGHDTIHFVQRWLTYGLIAVFTVLTVGSVVVLGGPRVLSMGAFNSVAFFSQCAAVAGYLIAYAIYVSDYTRYLPPKTKLGPLVLWTYAGGVLSALWLMPLGALFALELKNGATVTSVLTVGNMIAPGFGVAVMIISSVALITVMSVNTYGATLVALTAVDGFRPIRSSSRIRIIGTLSVSLLILAIALTVPDSYQNTLTAFLTLLLYFLIPWSAVNLVDYYWIRRGMYSVLEIFSHKSIYRRWAWRGLVAYAGGFLVMVPFFALPSFTGPAARALGGVDLSILFGLPVSGLLYYVLARNLNLADEMKAYHASLAALEPASVAHRDDQCSHKLQR
jgi:NCS1 family nucleobase:cation symporter-1